MNNAERIKGVLPSFTYNKALDSINSFISTFSNYEKLTLTVPKNIQRRTKLICELIEDKSGNEFSVADFIMVLYLEFIEVSITNYRPSLLREQLTRSYGYNEHLIIHNKESYFKVQKKDEPSLIIEITMDKKDAEKGKLLLDELDSLYNLPTSLNQMVSKLWINFIEEYKAGRNTQALDQIWHLMQKYL